MSTAFETDSEFAVVLLTQDGTIIDAHPTCYESLGWNREELAGKDIGELLQSDRELLMSQLLQSKDEELGVDGQTSFSLRILARRRDETSFPARVVVRRFDQTGCCTAAFYRVNPHNDSDTPPIVRPEEIELAMRANAGASASQNAASEKPKSRWRNARLLFGAKPQPKAPPVPVAAPEARAVPVPAAPQAQGIPARSVRQGSVTQKLNPQIPENLFQRRDVPIVAAPSAVQTPAPEVTTAQEETPASEAEAIQAVPLSPAREPIVQPEESSPSREDEHQGTAASEALVRELEQEREERRRLEQRAASLTAQVSALHLQVGENLDIESRNQKKVGTLEEQLRESRNQVTQLKADLASERQKAASIQDKVEAASAVATSISEQLEALKLVHDALTRTQSECESQLKTVNGELKQAQEALATETAKRQELELALTSAQQFRSEQDRISKLELSKLETVLKEKELEFKEVQTRNAQANLQAKS